MDTNTTGAKLHEDYFEHDIDAFAIIMKFDDAPNDIKELVRPAKSDMNWMVVFPGEMIDWEGHHPKFKNEDMRNLPKSLGKNYSHYKSPNGDCITVTHK